MPADLDQFGSQNSHGAVIGGKGLVQLGHVAADARGLFHQKHLEAGGGHIQGGLNAADSSAQHHDVSGMALGAVSSLFVFHCFVLFFDGVVIGFLQCHLSGFSRVY
jgi:hypothetical protein